VTDLSTTYLGLPLTSPLVASPSPLTGSIESLLALEDAGAAAVVLPSLFEEQLALDAELWARADTANIQGRREYDVDLDQYNAGSASYLRLVEQARSRLEIPVIASLNCARATSWPDYTRMLVGAGAQAIELNVHIVAVDPSRTSQQVEDEYVELVGAVVEASAVPVAVKLAPYITAPVHLATRLEAAGAAGLVLFSRLHEPEINLPRVESISSLHLSTSAELGLRLRWLAILRDRVGLSLAATGGVWHGEDALKAVLAGADVVMVASVLLERGPSALSRLEVGLTASLAEAGLDSVAVARGRLSLGAENIPATAERAAYLHALLGAAARV
jgi:dihydroorotate dehydrogenase (fumarate)